MGYTKKVLAGPIDSKIVTVKMQAIVGGFVATEAESESNRALFHESYPLLGAESVVLSE